jgi:hypothetical protein
VYPHLLNTFGESAVRRLPMEDNEIYPGPNSQTWERAGPAAEGSPRVGRENLSFVLREIHR